MSTMIFELPASAAPIDAIPLIYGLVLYPGFQALDVFGPLDALNTLSLAYPLKLYILADTLGLVSTKTPQNIAFPGSDFGQSIAPTHTFDNAPKIDVLIVPGGLGNRLPASIDGVINYIGKVYPSLNYLITICTGSAVAARTGILDGKRATTNKRGWTRTVRLRPQVNWIAHARWVVDGNIWTASGVSAGIDATLDFISNIYGSEVAKQLADFMEYEWHSDPSWDPYADLYGLVNE